MRWSAAVKVLGRQPLVLPALASLLIVLAVLQSPWWWVAWLVVLAVSVRVSRRVWGLVLGASVVVGSMSWREAGAERRLASQMGEYGAWQVVVLDEVDTVEWQSSMAAKLVGKKARGAVVSLVLREEAVGLARGADVGDVLEVQGGLVPLERGRNPEVFAQGDFLHSQGVRARLVAQQGEDTGRVLWRYYPLRWAAQLRADLRDKLVRGLDAEQTAAQVIRAMVLGEKPQGESSLKEDFRRSGTLHVFAVSGLHVMLVGSLVVCIARVLALPAWLWVPVACVVMGCYALVTGLNPPALRAWVMATVFMGGWLVQRRALLANSVAAGALVSLCLDPGMALHPSFHLSFGVLVAIILSVHLWLKLMASWSALDAFMPRRLLTPLQRGWWWLRKQVVAGLAVGLSAFLGATPFTWWHFGVVTPMSIVATLPMLVFLYVVMALASVSLLLGALWPASAVWVNRLNAVPAVAASWTASAFARVDGGHFQARQWEHGERLVVYSLERGGMASYVGVGGGTLIDVGWHGEVEEQVLASLREHGAQVDSVVLTHGDSRHVSGMEAVLEALAVGQVMVPAVPMDSRVYEGVLAQVQARELHLVRALAGEVFSLDGDSAARLEVLWPLGNEVRYADDGGLVLRLHWRGLRVLFVADAGFGFEQYALNEGVDVGADMVVMGKHRRDLSGGRDFLQAVGAQWVLATQSRWPEGEWREEDWAEDLRAKGVEVVFLGVDGAIMVEWGGEEFEVLQWREGAFRPCAAGLSGESVDTKKAAP